MLQQRNAVNCASLFASRRENLLKQPKKKNDMKQPKLYIKNEKGRYEEYQIPDVDISDTLFRRINGKYVPVSINCANDLPEGVWVVTRGRSSREIISGKYLKESMMLDKVSDLEEMPNLAELGGWRKCVNYILRTMGDISAMTKADIVNTIVGKVFLYSKRGEL